MSCLLNFTLFIALAQALSEPLDFLGGSEYLQEAESPTVNNWAEAKYFSEVIKIPLVPGEDTTYLANLQMGTPRQIQGQCTMSNRHEIVTYAHNCTQPVVSCAEEE